MNYLRNTRCIVAGLSMTAGVAQAQPGRFNYPDPAPGSVVVAAAQSYAPGDRSRLMDVYSPARGKQHPAVIFFNVSPTTQRNTPLYTGWGRTVAAQGIVGIVPDLRPDSAAADLSRLLAHITGHADTYGIDPDAIALYAGSGNAFTAFPLVEDAAQRIIKAAVIYYGRADIPEFRRDLPVLIVRAGLDRPRLNARITTLAALAISQNAPVTLLNHPTGHHGFEVVDDGPDTRAVVDRTIQFVRSALSPAYQTSLREHMAESTAAAWVQAGNFHDASTKYAELVAKRPDDALLGLAYGEALLGDAQYAAACAAFESLREKGLGMRDLGLPAAEACAKAAKPDVAVAWLRTIAPRFLPPNLATDPAFAALRERQDFRALLEAQRN